MTKNIFHTIIKMIFISQFCFLVACGNSEENLITAQKENTIGYNYQTGKGVKKDFTKAFQHYLKAAKLGLAKAQHNVANMYKQGHGVKQDSQKAIDWYTKSAEQDYSFSHYSLGVIYLYGIIGVDKDDSKTFQHFSKGAELGDPPSQFELGLLYSKGQGIKQDYDLTMKWIKLSAKQGDELAISFLRLIAENEAEYEKERQKSAEKKMEKIIVDEIWNQLKNNRDFSDSTTKYLEVDGELIKKGTVLPSAIGSLVKGRLPAYLSCYDYISATRYGEFKSDMCVYYVKNPERGTTASMFRGRKYIGKLTSTMSNDGFKPSK